MYQDTRRLDFHALGREIKRKREAKGWTQEYLAQLVDRTPRSIMYFENRGQHPSLNTFYQIVTLLDISVDQFFYPDRQNSESDCRQHIDRLLNSMDEKELTVMEATAEGLQKPEKRRSSKKGLRFSCFWGLSGGAAKWQAMLLWPQKLFSQARPCGPSVKICLLGSLPKPGASGQVGPKCQRRFAPYASQSLTLLFLLSARLRVAQ